MRVSEASKKLNVTPMALWLAIRQGRMTCSYEGKHIVLSKSDVRKYRSRRWKRSLDTSPPSGMITPRTASKRYATSLGTIYEYLYTNKIDGERVGVKRKTWLINEKSLQKHLRNLALGRA